MLPPAFFFFLIQMFQLNTTPCSSFIAFKGLFCNLKYIYQIIKATNPGISVTPSYVFKTSRF